MHLHVQLSVYVERKRGGGRGRIFLSTTILESGFPCQDIRLQEEEEEESIGGKQVVGKRGKKRPDL